MTIDEKYLNINNYLYTCFLTFALLSFLYIICNYTIYIILALITIYINIYYSDKVNYYKTKIIDYVNNLFTGYLGNCTFDPLPKTKT
jgi:hypothetical protein